MRVEANWRGLSESVTERSTVRDPRKGRIAQICFIKGESLAISGGRKKSESQALQQVKTESQKGQLRISCLKKERGIAKRSSGKLSWKTHDQVTG